MAAKCKTVRSLLGARRGTREHAFLPQRVRHDPERVRGILLRREEQGCSFCAF